MQYAVEFWPYVMNVLEDGHLELSNNVAEQAQRIFVVGRKNWLFSDAPRGARASAAIYSVTTTAKANGLNPRLYVEWLLTEMPNAGELTDEVVDSFLPWSDRVPESCKLDPAAAEKAKEMPDDFIINIDPDAFDDEMANNAEEGL
nr:transposase [Bifidobacterium longum]